MAILSPENPRNRNSKESEFYGTPLIISNPFSHTEAHQKEREKRLKKERLGERKEAREKAKRQPSGIATRGSKYLCFDRVN